MKTRVTTSAVAITHLDCLAVSTAIARLGAMGELVSHGGSLKRSILCVSVNTWDGSNHDADPMADLRSLLTTANVTLVSFDFADTGTRSAQHVDYRRSHSRMLKGLRCLGRLANPDCGNRLYSSSASMSLRASHG